MSIFINLYILYRFVYNIYFSIEHKEISTINGCNKKINDIFMYIYVYNDDYHDLFINDFKSQTSLRSF